MTRGRCRRLFRIWPACATVLAGCIFFANAVCAEFLKSWTARLTDPVATIADGFYAVHELPTAELVTVGAATNWYKEWFIAIVRADGTTKWQVVLDDPQKLKLAAASTGGISIIADPSNNPVVAYPCDTNYGATCLAKFGGTDGAVVWRQQADGLSMGECRVETADTTGFFRICQNGPIQRRDWNGNVLWQVVPPFSTRIALPLSNGNFVLSDYANVAGTFAVLAQASGTNIGQGTISGNVYGAVAVRSGGFLLHTQRTTGPSTYASTLDRFSDQGATIWRHDFAVGGYSFSGQPLVVTDNTAVRYTISSTGQSIHVATNLAGQFLWQKPANAFSPTVVANNNLYAVESGAINRVDPASGALLGSVSVPGGQHVIFGLSIGLILFRQSPDAVGTVLERYSPEIVRAWRASLFAIEPQLLVTPSYPPDLQYVPRLCDKLRVQPPTANFDLFLSRWTGTNSNGSQLRQHRQNVAGNLIDEAVFADGSVCAASQRNGADSFALGLDNNLRRLTPNGTVVWSTAPDGAWSVYGSYATELSNGNIAVAASMPISGTWIFAPLGAPRFPRANLGAGVSGVRAGHAGNYFVLLNDSSVSHVTNQGVVSWNKKFGDAFCFYDGPTGGIRDMVTARNGDLLLGYHTCQNAARVVRLTPAGDVLWESPLAVVGSGSSFLRLSKVVESANGSVYAVGCASTSGGRAFGNYSVIRALDANGVAEWSKDIDIFVNATECATTIVASPESIFLTAATSDDTCSKSVLLRMNSAGIIEFADLLSLANPQVLPTEMGLTQSNSLIIAGNGYDSASRRRVSSVREVLPRGDSCDFDVNGDGSVQMTTDVVPILRTMFAFGAFGLDVPSTTCSLGPEIAATRARSAVGITPYRSQTTLSADVDQDGVVNPLIDGLLLVRAQLGIPESRLTQGLQFPVTAARTNPGAIAAYLRSCGVAVAP